MDGLPYRSLIGCLAYLASGTRSDISYAVSLLSRSLANPTLEHWRAALHVLRYVEATNNRSLRFKKEETPATEFKPEDLNNQNESGGSGPEIFVDSDWQNDVSTSRSTGGQLLTVNNGAVSWRSKLQSVVASSTAHAEYIALSEASREAMWLRQLLSQIGFHLDGPSVAHEDNAAANHLTKNEAITDRCKHFRTKWHIVREYVRDGILAVDYIPSAENPADALTKPATRASLAVLAEAANLLPGD